MGSFADALSVLDAGGSTPAATESSARPRVVIQTGNKGAFSSALDVLDNPSAAAPEPKKGREVGVGEALGRGAIQGISMNFGDELAGLTEAGGGDPTLKNDRYGIDHLVMGLVKYFAGNDEARRKYEEAVAREREANKVASEQHPVATVAGELGGALALPVGAAARAATLPGRMAQGAAVGAGYGAAFGAGEGEGAADRASRAVSGAALGGVAGGLAPAVVAGAGKAVEGVKSLAGVKGAIDAESEAARRVAEKLRADAERGATVSPSDISAAVREGQPMAVADFGGENVRALARSSANVSPSARDALTEMSDQRYGEQGKRISEFVRGLSPMGGRATLSAEALDRAAKAANKPAYAKAYREGENVPFHEGFQQLMTAPDVQDAVRQATRTGANKAAAQGFQPAKSPFKFDENGLPQLSGDARPTLQFWDAVKQNLDDKINTAMRSGEKGHAGDLIDLKNQLVSHLDEAVPSYKAARQGAAAFFGAESALEAGQKFVGMQGSLDSARAALAKMNPAQRTLFAEGFASEIADKVSKIADNRSAIIDRIFNSQDGRARISLALGAQNASKLETFLRIENIQQATRKAITGNSTTVRQAIEARLAGGLGQAALAGGLGSAAGAAQAAFSGNVDTKTLITAALVGTAAGTRAHVSANVAQKVGELLASTNPADMLKVVRMAEGNPKIGKAVRRAETFMEKLGASRAGSAAPSLTNGMLPVAAEQEQSQPGTGR